MGFRGQCRHYGYFVDSRIDDALGYGLVDLLVAVNQSLSGFRVDYRAGGHSAQDAPLWRRRNHFFCTVFTGQGSRGAGENLARLNVFAVFHVEVGVFGQRIVFAEFFPADQAKPAAFFLNLHGDGAVDIRQNRGALGYSSLKQLFNPGQTAGDVQTGNTAGVEGTHGELSARFTDALGCDDADCLPFLDSQSRGWKPSVAHLAEAAVGFTGQCRPYGYFVDSRIDDVLSYGLVDLLVAVNQNLSGFRVNYRASGHSAQYALL